jgi:hypothetical protein
MNIMAISVPKLFLSIGAAVAFAVSVTYSQGAAAAGAPEASNLAVEKADTSEGISEEPVSSVNVPDTAAKALPPVNTGKVLREEDMLIIEGEEEENIFRQDAAPAVPAKPAQAAADSAPVPSSNVNQTSGQTAGEPASAESQISVPAAAAEVPVPLKQKAVIEEERSINFARNLKEYRSPRLAMFLSLIIPGLGQAYTGKYVKTAVFGVAEAAIIGAGAYFGIRGRDEKKEARRFADANFDMAKLWKYYNDIDSLLWLTLSVTDTMVADVKSGVLAWDSTEFAEAAAAKNNSYYNEIENHRIGVVQGWKDCEPVLDITSSGETDQPGYILEDPDYKYKYTPRQVAGEGDTIWLVSRFNKTDVAFADTLESYLWGYSEQQRQYSSMVSQANDYYKISSRVLFLLIANHVISSVDAMISAKAHNDKLLNKESLWRRINLDQNFAMTESGIRTSFAVRYRF